MNNNFFSLRRFWLQLKRDMVLYSRSVLYLYAAMSLPYLFKILFSLFTWNFPGFSVFFQSQIYLISLFLIIVILAAVSFKDFRNDLSAQMYLLIPSSAFEKFLSMFLFVFVVNPVVLTVAFYVIDIIFVALAALFGHQFQLVNVFSSLHNSVVLQTNSILFAQFVGTIAVYFAGAATFKKDAWLKTMLLIFVITTAFFWLVGITVLVYVKLLKIIGLSLEDVVVGVNGNLFSSWIVELAYWSVPVVFTIIAYFKVKEKEV